MGSSYAASVNYLAPTMAPTILDLPNLPDLVSANSTEIINNALQAFEDTVNSLPPWAHTTLAITAIVIGFICCFAGARYGKFSVFVLGFEVGAYIGLLVAHETYHNEDNLVKARVTAAVVGGCLVGGLSLCTVKVAKLVTGVALALTAGAIIADSGLVAAVGNSYFLWGIVAVLVIGAAYFAFKIVKIMIALATAFCGSFGMALGISHFIDGHLSVLQVAGGASSDRLFCMDAANRDRDKCIGLLSGWAFLGCAGFCLQMRQLYPSGHRSGEEDEDRLQRKVDSARQKRREQRYRRASSSEEFDIVCPGDRKERQGRRVVRVRMSKRELMKAKIAGKLPKGAKRSRIRVPSNQSHHGDLVALEAGARETAI